MRSIGLEHETHGHGFVRVHMAQHISLTCVSNQRFESYYHIVKIASHDLSLQKTKAYTVSEPWQTRFQFVLWSANFIPIEVSGCKPQYAPPDK